MATARKPRKTPPARPAAKKEKAATPPLGRYLRKFTLQNVRTFRSPVTLDFCKEDGSVAQWTVILGENGTGKTTLLQYLAGMTPTEKFGGQSARDNWKGGIAPKLVSNKWDNWNLANLPVAGGPRIEAELTVSLATDNLSSLNSCKDEKASIKFEVEFATYIAQKLRVGAGYYSADVFEFAKQISIFGYGANRYVAGPASPYLSSQTFYQNSGDPTSTLYYDDHPLISPEQWLLGLDHTSRIKGEGAINAKRALQSAQRCLAKTLPDVKGFAVKPRVTGEGYVVMTVMCETPYGEVLFGALSVGYRTMAAWLTDFVKRMHEAFPDLEEPDNGPAIVLIDEFDLHMHPKWQREAMAALSEEFPNTQFIVTAHSPLIVQATEGEAKIIVLRRSKREDGTEEVLVDDHPRYAAGWRVDQILSSDLYGMDPRSPKYDALVEEGIRLRQKERRTAKEERRLLEIEAELEQEAPPGTSSASRQLLADLERALGEAHANGK